MLRRNARRVLMALAVLAQAQLHQILKIVLGPQLMNQVDVPTIAEVATLNTNATHAINYGTYWDGNFCQNCDSSCGACSGAGNNACTSRSGSFLLGTACVNPCPSGMYGDNAVCDNCVSPIATCTSATVAQSCISGYYLFTENSSCASTCPSNTMFLA